MNQTLIVGYGYLGKQVAKNALANGDHVFATTRSEDKFAKIKDAGCEPIELDWTKKLQPGQIPPADRVLVAVSYDRKSSIDRYTYVVEGLSRLLDVLPAKTRVCYISTTGVYHQKDHVWVDETSSTRPTRDGGKAHLQAEAVLRRKMEAAGHTRGAPSLYTTLRLSGIYGPGRIPRAADVLAGRPIASPEHGYLNLIHVEDAANAVMAAWKRMDWLESTSRRLYTVSDDAPVVRSEFYTEIARHYGVDPPTFVQPAADSPVLMRSESSKRVWNRRMKRDLAASLVYPDYRAGLKQALPDPESAGA